MGKGRKRRGTKSGDNALKAAPSLLNASEEGLPLKAAAEDSNGFLQQEQVKTNASNAEKTNRVNVEAAPSADNKNKAPFVGESSFFRAPKKASSVPCRYFQRGYCREGGFCRFQHLEVASASKEPPNSAAKAPLNMRDKAPSEKACPPEECLDWYLTGSCPRYRTCRYAHPISRGVGGSTKNMRSTHMDFGMAQLLLQGLGASRGGGRNDVMRQQMMNGGFTDDDVYELSLQGIKPWDPEARDALAVLNGWDMDGGYDYDDSDYDDDDNELFGF